MHVGQKSHIWEYDSHITKVSYENHMTKVSYENHMTKVSYENHMTKVSNEKQGFIIIKGYSAIE